MAKILLVEDDNNLREIYEARLQAEGYEIVSAKDGEEALVVAKKERPDLIIADVMMPRISGFEMLDILRNTPELKDVHVIMLTALGQAEDKTRADSLGADRYLVKSQVTLEDIVKAAADVMAGAPATTPAMAAAANDAQQQAASPTPPATAAPAPPAAPTNIPVIAAPSTPITPAPAANPPATPPAQQDTPAAPQQATAPAPDSVQPAAAAAPITDTPSMPPPEPSATDSQLVTNAVNNLAAGTSPAPDGSAQPQAAAPPAPQPPAMPTVMPQPQPGQTMQPVLEPPPAPAAPVADTPAPQPNAEQTTIRKSIQPLAPGASPSQPDLNELMAKEGHNLDEHTEGPPIFSGSHLPGNVISPGGADMPNTSPNNQTPSDPNSISL
ncbi:MAG: response regulator transcription factor [Candidatus Saccharimonadales bacterium]